MTVPDPNRNPSDDYPPTRPSAFLVILVVGLTVAVLGIENWSDLSPFAHIPRIERALGL